jgi:hypothetical protein
VATPNIVPRADLEGSIGTQPKRWGYMWANAIILGVDPSGNYDAVTKQYVDSLVASGTFWQRTTTASGNYLTPTYITDNIEIYGYTNVHGQALTGLPWPSGNTDAASKEYVDSTEGPSFNFENFSSLCNGFKVTFNLMYTPLSSSLLVFLNGLLQEPGGAKDFTFTGTSITFNTAPESGAILLVQYAY